MKWILVGIAELFLAVVCAWIIKQCWRDMRELLDSLDEPEIFDIEEDEYE